MYSDWNIERTKTHITHLMYSDWNIERTKTHNTFNVLGLKHIAHDTYETHI